ncbi:transcriptional regulator NanR [Salinisphaera sp. Q1T1-3]|uniref:transcriptional regulator NanR n=1 Tax=Salinisphaera sp. Q1T1-3 TaxID=2321229 RepID=UPI000E744E79|nr:transcriptional regulator NanR [Salinisphaera sp. Q1T1-3]RJS91896.1 transcriptional regulator NanR [Salinisphaera sp. Q1T1-3]
MSEGSNAPIRRRKLSDEVLERLLTRIRSGHFQAGDQLPPERELMREYDVGRPAVREAMQQLASMGMIAISHGERARVTEVTVHTMINQFDRTARFLLSESADNIDHLKEARLFLETGMTRMAAEKATTGDVDQLHRIIDDMVASAGTPEFIDHDMAFHNTIAEVSGNPIFAATSRAMLHWLKDYYVGIVSFKGAEDVSVSEHRQITARIAEHDAEGAANAMRDHLTRASELYRARANPD